MSANVLICMRVDSGGVRLPDSKSYWCSRCGAAVWAAKSGQAKIEAGFAVVCLPCVPQSELHSAMLPTRSEIAADVLSRN